MQTIVQPGATTSYFAARTSTDSQTVYYGNIKMSVLRLS